MEGAGLVKLNSWMGKRVDVIVDFFFFFNKLTVSILGEPRPVERKGKEALRSEAVIKEGWSQWE